MKKYFLFIFLFISCFCFFSQNQKQDSLWSVYNNKSLPDTSRLKAIHAIAWNLRGNNPDTAIVFAEQERKLAEASHQKKWEGGAINIIGISFMYKGNYP